MVHTQRQHDPDGDTREVHLSSAQFDDLKAFFTGLQEKAAPQPALSGTQFEKLISMLQPGFELSTRMLAEQRAAGLAPPAAAGPPVDTEAVAKNEQADQQRERALAVDQGAFPDAPGFGDQRNVSTAQMRSDAAKASAAPDPLWPPPVTDDPLIEPEPGFEDF
jgi:hypothetical protein